jgi:putative exporter of polyketide antibiotics
VDNRYISFVNWGKTFSIVQGFLRQGHPSYIFRTNIQYSALLPPFLVYIFMIVSIICPMAAVLFKVGISGKYCLKRVLLIMFIECLRSVKKKIVVAEICFQSKFLPLCSQ